MNAVLDLYGGEREIEKVVGLEELEPARREGRPTWSRFALIDSISLPILSIRSKRIHVFGHCRRGIFLNLTWISTNGQKGNVRLSGRKCFDMRSVIHTARYLGLR